MHMLVWPHLELVRLLDDDLQLDVLAQRRPAHLCDPPLLLLLLGQRLLAPLPWRDTHVAVKAAAFYKQQESHQGTPEENAVHFFTMSVHATRGRTCNISAARHRKQNTIWNKNGRKSSLKTIHLCGGLLWYRRSLENKVRPCDATSTSYFWPSPKSRPPLSYCC